MKSTWRALFFLSLLLGFQSSQALSLIDDFSDDLPTVYSPASGSTTLLNPFFSNSRDWSLSHLGRMGSFLIYDGMLALNSNADTQAILTLSYANGAGFDFTPFGNAFFLDVDNVESNGVTLTLTVDGSQHSRTINAPGHVTFLFEDLSGADMTNVHNVSLEIYSGYQVDSGYRSFGVKVPEPLPLALLALGALVAAGRRGAGLTGR